MAATATSEIQNSNNSSDLKSEVPPNGPNSADNSLEIEISDEIQEQAEALKTEANAFFKQEKFQQAVDLYSKAIELNPKKAVYHANRSIANLRLENFGYALSDASKSIECDKNYLKAYYRRAAAHMALGKYKIALKDYERVFKVRPNDADAKKKYTECKKIVQQQAFEKGENRSFPGRMNRNLFSLKGRDLKCH